MKKVVAVLTALCLLLTLFTACNNSSATPTTAAQTTAATVTEGAAPPSTTAGSVGSTEQATVPQRDLTGVAPVNLIFASVQTAASVEPQAIVWFCDQVRERSEGLVTVEFFPDGVLANSDRLIVEQVMIGGSIDMAHVGPGIWGMAGGKIFDGWSMPYLVNNYDELEAVMEEALFPYIMDGFLEMGVRPLWAHVGGARGILSKTPINSVADLQGKKWRVPDNRIFKEYVQTWGATALPVAPAEVYVAMQSGVVDTIDMAMPSILNNSWDEVAGYFSVTNHVNPIDIIGITEAKWQTIDPKLQEIILECGQETQKYQLQLQREYEEKDFKRFVERGGTLIEFTPEQMAEMRSMLDPMYANFNDEYDLTTILASIEKATAKLK